MTRKEIYENILKSLHKTYLDKNNDYGNSVGKTYEKYGLVSFLVRLEDKMNRLESLQHSDRKVDETIKDTLLDLANYAILALVELEKCEINDENSWKNVKEEDA